MWLPQILHPLWFPCSRIPGPPCARSGRVEAAVSDSCLSRCSRSVPSRDEYRARVYQLLDAVHREPRPVSGGGQGIYNALNFAQLAIAECDDEGLERLAELALQVVRESNRRRAAKPAVAAHRFLVIRGGVRGGNDPAARGASC